MGTQSIALVTVCLFSGFALFLAIFEIFKMARPAVRARRRQARERPREEAESEARRWDEEPRYWEPEPVSGTKLDWTGLMPLSACRSSAHPILDATFLIKMPCPSSTFFDLGVVSPPFRGDGENVAVPTS